MIVVGKCDYCGTELDENGRERWETAPTTNATIAHTDATCRERVFAALQSYKREMLVWAGVPDEWDDAIKAAFPTRSGSHEQYATAMKMVGHRHSKGELVALVNWLLLDRDRAREGLLRCAKTRAEYQQERDDARALLESATEFKFTGPGGTFYAGAGCDCETQGECGSSHAWVVCKLMENGETEVVDDDEDNERDESIALARILAGLDDAEEGERL